MNNRQFYAPSDNEINWFLGHFKYSCREYKKDEYSIDKQWLKLQKVPHVEGTEIQEKCLVLIIDQQNCIKIYTSQDRRSKEIRSKGTDAIHIVAADRFTFEPILDKFPHTKRLKTWKNNVMDKIMDALYQLGYWTALKKCGHDGILREKREDGSLFLGCSKFIEGKCQNAEPLVQRPGNQSRAPKEREIFSK